MKDSHSLQLCISPTSTDIADELLQQLTDEEKKKLAKLESVLRQRYEYSDSTDVHNRIILDKATLIRFMRTSKWKKRTTQKLIKDWITWRSTMKPHQITPNMVANELASGKAFWHGRDRDGRPVCVIRPHMHDVKKRNLEEYFRFAAYMLELAKKLMNKPQECCAILDARYLTYQNFDAAAVKELIRIGNFYREHLKHAYIFKPSWSYHLIYKLVRPMLDSYFVERIVVINHFDELKTYIAEDQILDEFGGSSKFIDMDGQSISCQ